jgi:ferredoxin--NADP+ reductase
MAGNNVGPTADGLRVAIVGAGPAGFYAAEMLVQKGASVDLFERWPAPFGLLRYGVAPDHQNIKRAGAAFERTARHASLRFWGNVEIGRDLSVEELLSDYDQVLFATGSASDRKMGIPGEELVGSIAATTFVGWYNGHPEFSSHGFDLSGERAIVVGMGNVAMDVARLLVKRPADLRSTDIAHYALEALEKSAIREVILLGRRGPAQAAFDQGELADIADLAGVEVVLDSDISLEGLAELSAAARRNVEFMATLRRTPSGNAERVVRLRFFAAPHAIVGENGRVAALEVERTELVRRSDGSVSARGTGEIERLAASLVVRSIGYQATLVQGLPFDAHASLIPNVGGRVGKPGEIVPRAYVVGWIKRGPIGLLGTNKQDAKETVEHMLIDREISLIGRGERVSGRAVRLLAERGVRAVSYADWQRIDERERALGTAKGKIREKFVSLPALLAALDPDNAEPARA